MSPLLSLPVLYAITDRRLAAGRSHALLVRLLAAGGARLIQIREKDLSDAALLHEARAARQEALASGVRLVMNDRPDLAAMALFDGVHVGSEDLPPAAARAIVGEEAIVGCSTHALEEAVRADRLQVVYIALGPIFATRHASVQREPLGLTQLARAAAAVGKPLIAIGGIDLARAREALSAGAAAVAVMGDLMTAPDIPERTASYVALG